MINHESINLIIIVVMINSLIDELLVVIELI